MDYGRPAILGNEQERSITARRRPDEYCGCPARYGRIYGRVYRVHVAVWVYVAARRPQGLPDRSLQTVIDGYRRMM